MIDWKRFEDEVPRAGRDALVCSKRRDGKHLFEAWYWTGLFWQAEPDGGVIVDDWSEFHRNSQHFLRNIVSFTWTYIDPPEDA